MGKGIDLARADGPEHAALLDDLKDQLLIVFLKRLQQQYGDDLIFPVIEIDKTGMDLVSFSIEERCFIFKLSKKS